MIMFPKTHTLKSFEDGEFIKGKFIPGAQFSRNTIADIQPITGKELESLNIGRQELGKIKIYTDDIYTISKEGTTKNSDIIVWKGNDYEIIQKLPYDGDLINHNKYIAEIRVEDDLNDAG